MIQVPQNKQWKQSNTSDVFGSLWSSFNLDLSSNLGRTCVSPRLMVSSSTEFIATLTTAPCAFTRYSNAYWTISGTQVHTTTTDLLSASWSADASTGTPTDCDVAYSDMVLFNNGLYVSGKSNKLYGFNGTNWTSNSSPYTIGGSDVGPHPMTVYGDKLYYVRAGNIIYSLNTSYTVSAVLLTLGGGDEVITWMRSATNRIWIGTLNRYGGKGSVYEWDGASTQVTRSYRLPSRGALACVIKDDVPWIVDSDGSLLTWSSGTFKEVARLPIVNKKFLYRATYTTSNTRFIHPNGMAVVNGEIMFVINNLNGDNSATIEENRPSGIWAYDPNIGLYHKYSFSYQDDDDTSASITDYGQNRISVAGALAEFKTDDSGSASSNGTFLAGATYYTDASSTRSAVFIDDRNDTMPKSGYFVTSWIDSTNIKDIWEKIYVRHRKFLDSSDRIVLKYRVTEVNPVEISFTWSSDNAIHSTTDLTGYIGYEVEFLQGQGSGLTAHITSVATVGSNYIATLDTSFTGETNGNTGKARLQDWVKIGTISNQTEEIDRFLIGVNSSRIQLKCFMLFTGRDEFHELLLINNPKQLV